MTVDKIEYYELLKVAISQSKSKRLIDGLDDAKGIEKKMILKELRKRKIDAQSVQNINGSPTRDALIKYERNLKNEQ